MPKVYGLVRDAETGRPLPGVGVMVGSFPAVSGPDGRYQVEVPAGTYTVTVKNPMYRPFQTLIHVARDTPVDIDLYKAVPI